MSSAVHRSNMLEPGVVCMGAGVSLHSSASGGVEILVTQEFCGELEKN